MFCNILILLSYSIYGTCVVTLTFADYADMYQKQRSTFCVTVDYLSFSLFY